jgi:hypothetical protein
MGGIDSLKRSISNFTTSVGNGVQRAENAVESGATAAVNTAKQGVQDTFTVAKGAVQQVENATTAAVNTVKQGAQDTFTAAKGVAQSAVNKAASLLDPTSFGGPDAKYDGQYVGAGGKTYPASTPLADVPPVEPKGGKKNNEVIIYTNGINTTKDTQAASLQDIADTTGSEVIGVHNSTNGMAADLEQCVLDKADKGNNPAVNTLADTVYSQLKAGKDVHLMGHSQGGLITARALDHVQQRLMMEDGMSKSQAEQAMSHIKGETFGAASMHYPDGPQYVHYINRADLVPDLTGLGAAGATWNPAVDPGKGAQVHYFNSPHLNPIASHNFDDVYLKHRVPFDQARAGNFGNS